jgi:acetylornithine deacetylase/succinyl-diaminopimelate desuccinylase-like protein
MPGSLTHSAFSRIGQLASLPRVHAAFQWFHLQERRMMQWQQELVSIAAPPFGERRRAEWLSERFRELKLQQVEIDPEGNVLGYYPGDSSRASRQCVMLSAHIDTVFPIGTPIAPILEQNRLAAPGACDNGAGVAGLLGIAAALESGGIALPCDLLFAGNVGEEGEGDLRGMRHLYRENSLAGRIAAHIVMDGAGVDTAVTQALGSRRFHVTVQGPGGHSFTDAGTPNPIAALARALAALAETPLPEEPRTTLNLGTIRGGTSVNSIPESAEATIDFRSTGVDELVRLEVALHRTVEDAVDHCNRKAKAAGTDGRGRLDFAIRKIGDRPAARLAEDSALLATLQAVDRHLGLHTELRLGSTDANLPLSVGVPSLSIGAGGDGGGAHTLAEWYSAKDRELGLRRALLLVLAMVVWSHEQ